jgi:hypothetical protein
MLRKSVIVVSVLVLAVIVLTTSTHAFNPQPDPPGKWGMIGINVNEVGRLNIVSDDNDACTIGLGFVDADGKLIKGELKALRAGHAQFLEIMGSQAVSRGESRASIRPILRDAAGDPPGEFPPDPCRFFKATYEVYERGSGRSILVVPAFESTIPLATSSGR